MFVFSHWFLRLSLSSFVCSLFVHLSKFFCAVFRFGVDFLPLSSVLFYFSFFLLFSLSIESLKIAIILYFSSMICFGVFYISFALLLGPPVVPICSKHVLVESLKYFYLTDWQIDNPSHVIASFVVMLSASN